MARSGSPSTASNVARTALASSRHADGAQPSARSRAAQAAPSSASRQNAVIAAFISTRMRSSSPPACASHAGRWAAMAAASPSSYRMSAIRSPVSKSWPSSQASSARSRARSKSWLNRAVRAARTRVSRSTGSDAARDQVASRRVS